MMTKTFNQYLQNIFSLDLRSLAIYRICIGYILLVTLTIRTIDLKDHYSDIGVLPHDIALIDSGPFSWSLHALTGSWKIELILFTTAIVFAVMLIVGYKTRFATFISWLLFLSLCNRNVWVNSGADHVLRLLLFWSIFLPLGAKYSIDSLQYAVNKLPTHVFSPATVAYTLQLNFLYIFAALWKLDPIWIRDGTAIYYTLHNYIFVSSFGKLIDTYFSWSFSYLTYIVYLIEAFGFFFLYSPFKTGVVRTIAIFVFILMHIGIGLSMRLGMFSFVVIAGLIALLPSYFWENISISSFLHPSKIMIHIKKFLLNKQVKKSNPPNMHLSRISTIFITLCLAYITIYNSLGVSVFRPTTSPPILKIGALLGLQQRWSMFAPHPPTRNIWFVMPGKLKNGSYVDLHYYGESVRFDNPLDLNRTFKNAYEARYLATLNPNRYHYYTQYLCRKWNATHSKKEALQHITIYQMRQNIRLDKKFDKINKTLVYNWTCQSTVDTF